MLSCTIFRGLSIDPEIAQQRRSKMLDSNPSFWEEVKRGFFGVWDILPRAGAFGLGSAQPQ
jgi:hypothetical protein